MFTRNAQGNYDQGRGRDGLNGATPGSRFGTGVQNARRPRSVGGRENFVVNNNLAGGPTSFAPAMYARVGGPAIMAPGRVLPRKAPGFLKLARSRQQFVKWLERWSPKLYEAAKAKADMVERTEGTLGSLSGWFDTFMDTLSNVGGKVLTLKQQKELLDAQMERMRQGLPPLDVSQYAPTVNVGVDPATTRNITGAIGAGLMGALPWVAAGIAALVFLPKLIPRRR